MAVIFLTIALRLARVFSMSWMLRIDVSSIQLAVAMAYTEGAAACA